MLPVRMNRNGGQMLDNTFDAFRRELDRLLDVGQDVTDGGGQRVASYPVDVHEDADHIYVEAELPGFTRDQVDVTIEHGTLSITAERRETSPQGQQNDSQKKDQQQQSQQRTTHLRERRYSRVQRRFSLPDTVDENNVDASLQDGVLHLTLHKKPEIKPRKIEVR